MSYEVYKVLHVLGFALLFTAFGAALGHNLRGEDKSTNPSRKRVAATHGIALVLLLVAGFGLAARTGLGGNPGGFPAWLWVKIAIWVMLGASIAWIQRKPGAVGRVLWWGLPVLAAVAAAMVAFKPGV